MFSDVVKHMLLKNIHVHSLNLLNFDYLVVFDIEAALENSKLAILERIELQQENCSVFYKNQILVYVIKPLKTLEDLWFSEHFNPFRATGLFL